MALFGEGAPSSLEDVLGRRAETDMMSLENQFAKKRRQSVAQQAHAGRLGSGVSNYQAADLDAAELSGVGDIESGLAESLGSIPAEDYSSGLENLRQEQLAALIGSLKRRGGLQSILGGAGALGGIGAQIGGPWGAVAGGGLGAILGGLD